MDSFKGSKTENNLKEAFSGESQARNKYTYFASVAKKEGYEAIGAIFLEIADQEKEHAKLELKYLNGIGNTEENIQSAINGENYEWTNMYDKFAKEAQEEGFIEISNLFQGLAKIEKYHEQIFQQLLDLIKNKKMFVDDKIVIWKCRNCGNIVLAKEAPLECSICKHPQSYFQKIHNE